MPVPGHFQCISREFPVYKCQLMEREKRPQSRAFFSMLSTGTFTSPSASEGPTTAIGACHKRHSSHELRPHCHSDTRALNREKLWREITALNSMPVSRMQMTKVKPESIYVQDMWSKTSCYIYMTFLFFKTRIITVTVWELNKFHFKHVNIESIQ